MLRLDRFVAQRSIDPRQRPPQHEAPDFFSAKKRGVMRPGIEPREALRIWVEARLAGAPHRQPTSHGLCRSVEVPPGMTIAGLVELLRLPVSEIGVVLRNGCDVTEGIGARPVPIEDGDIIAFSGPPPTAATRFPPLF
jgi:hypothetical protein